MSIYEKDLHASQNAPVADSIASDYKILFESGTISDFELHMNDDKTLKAHKAILVARSPVFFKMLTTDMQEANKSSVDVPDFDSKTMKELLRFIYCNEVENLKLVAFTLIYAAEKYEIVKLKKICCDDIISKLSAENVVDALIIADRVSDMEKLFHQCIEFVVE